MDLIYTDAAGKELGILEPTYFDEYYGVNQENTFEVHIAKDYHCCEKDSLIYAENSDLGGIVDSIYSSTDEDDVRYTGRTWAGILNSKIIEPPEDEDYLVVDGEANSVLKELIELMGLDDIFAVSSIDTGIEIVNYQVTRYIKGYDCILSMLNKFDAKLSIIRKYNKTILSVENTIDYSEDNELLSQQYSMSVKQSYNMINHLICLGQGELKNRAVIHLFVDENGGVMPYSNTDNPIQDSDYIIDKSQQQLFGINENTDTYDYSSAEITYNYVPLTTQPGNWAKTFENYYMQDDDGSFNLVKATTQDTYTLLTSKPSDWSSNFASYYIKNGNSYKTVEGDDSHSYKVLTKKPSGWSSSYNQYFEYESDGVTDSYKSVSGVLKYKYCKQTKKPTDWSDNYKSYYKKNSKGKYVKLDTAKAPNWKAKVYYTRVSYTAAPAWSKGKYFIKAYNDAAPAWASNTYYSRVSKTIVPGFKSGKYYSQVEDRFAVLIEGGIERLKELRSSQEINVSLSNETDYSIGDTIGGTENITNISVKQQIILKRIYLNEYNEYEEYFDVGDFDI